jgi:hypothetical protein
VTDSPASSAAQCSAGELETLVSLGMEKSGLGNHRSVGVGLVGEGVGKQPLRSLVGVISTGGSYGDNAECTWLIAPPGRQSDA